MPTDRIVGMQVGELVDDADTCALEAGVEHREWMRVWMDRMLRGLDPGSADWGR